MTRKVKVVDSSNVIDEVLAFVVRGSRREVRSLGLFGILGALCDLGAPEAPFRDRQAEKK